MQAAKRVEAADLTKTSKKITRKRRIQTLFGNKKEKI